MTADEPITVEVLRRGKENSAASNSASNRNSIVIPPAKSPSTASIRSQEVQTEARSANSRLEDHDHDHEIEELDPLLVPGLDYEVQFKRYPLFCLTNLTLFYEVNNPEWIKLNPIFYLLPKNKCNPCQKVDDWIADKGCNFAIRRACSSISSYCYGSILKVFGNMISVWQKFHFEFTCSLQFLSASILYQ